MEIVVHYLVGNFECLVGHFRYLVGHFRYLGGQDCESVCCLRLGHEELSSLGLGLYRIFGILVGKTARAFVVLVSVMRSLVV
jgi:hypothetical protein